MPGFLHVSVLPYPSRLKETVHRVQKAGTADPGRLSVSDHMELHLAVFQIYMIDGPVAPPHAASDLRSLEGRSRCGRADRISLTVSQNHFSVSSDIHHKGKFFPFIEFRSQHTGGSICSHKTAYIGKPYKLRVLAHMDAAAGSLCLYRILHFRHIGRPHQRVHRKLQKKMMHTGVPCHNDLDDVFFPAPGFCRRLSQKTVYGLPDTAAQSLRPVFQDITAPHDHIRAVLTLRIQRASGT